MDQELRFGMQAALHSNMLGVDARVHVTLAHPDMDVVTARHAPHVRPEEHVREKQNLLVGWNCVDHLDRVSGRAAVVALRLYFGGGIHVGNDHGTRVLRLPRP